MTRKPITPDVFKALEAQVAARAKTGEALEHVLDDLRKQYSGLGPVRAQRLTDVYKTSLCPCPCPKPCPCAAQASEAEPAPAPKPDAKPVLFAPYVECWATKWNGQPLAGAPCKNFTFAFVVADAKGQPAFDGTMPVDRFLKDAQAIRARGGDFRISFGGASGREVASTIKDPAALAAAYRKVVDAYGARRLDFDIEGAAVADTKSNARRHQAIARLQADTGVKVDFTVATMPQGLGADVLAMLKDAVKAGVAISCVNIMAMDYSASLTGDMGAYAIQAATSTKKQLDAAGIKADVGITPMLGKNDIVKEVFTLDNARAVVEFAKKTPWVSLLAFWALGRDNSKATGVAQQPFDFTKVFAGVDA
jgi:hypothetical protein